MKLRHILSMVLAVSACATALNDANAQEKTRAQVRQELIDAENQGRGPEMSGTSAEGQRKAPNVPGSKDACVGPVSFCNIYFGS
jgi:hypothetical protein